MAGPGLIIAAPSTGSGKTTVTLGLLRALKRRGLRVAPAKIGPDYIDPQFHALACGQPSQNLDAWAMRPSIFGALVAKLADAGDLVVAEGVMGLFDGAERAGQTSDGSTAEVARRTDWPVVLVVNCSGLAQSIAPLAKGFCDFDEAVDVAGVILNMVAGARHLRMLSKAMDEIGVPVFGTLMRDTSIELPSRHLGLVQAEEQPGLEALLEKAGDAVEQGCDIERLMAIARPPRSCGTPSVHSVPIEPLGQRIAVASDVAFRFAYPHVLEGWRRAGAELALFSPLADEAPDARADAVYLPGGYPELHGARLAAAQSFIGGLGQAAENGVSIYGECGGYMVLGKTLVDADGVGLRMAGLLSVETSFAERRLHLGYRHISLSGPCVLGPVGQCYRGHEFHYASAIAEEGEALFVNLENQSKCGLRRGSVAGSFMHLIDRSDA